MYTRNNGSGGGFSVPERVLRTGAILPFNPNEIRSLVSDQHVEEFVRGAVGQQPGAAQYAPPPEPQPTGVLLGSNADGQPVTGFLMPGSPSLREAAAAKDVLSSAARVVRKSGIAPLVGGPLASLARGETTVLRWSNGVSIQVTL